MKLPETKNRVLKVEDGVAYLELTQGQVALVDVGDLDLVGQYRWHSLKGKNTVYVAHSRPNLLLHRLLMTPGNNNLVDHINHNGLDNRRNNLRVCTALENQRNRNSYIGASAFKGVYWCKKKKKWHARISVKYRNISLGYYTSETSAAEAYDQAALHLFGEYAKPNFNCTPVPGYQLPRPVYKSKFRGVGCAPHGRWKATIFIAGKNKHLGYFPSEAEAAVAYDIAALKLHGEFARTNILLTLPSKVQ